MILFFRCRSRTKRRAEDKGNTKSDEDGTPRRVKGGSRASREQAAQVLGGPILGLRLEKKKKEAAHSHYISSSGRPSAGHITKNALQFLTLTHSACFIFTRLDRKRVEEGRGCKGDFGYSRGWPGRWPFRKAGPKKKHYCFNRCGREQCHGLI